MAVNPASAAGVNWSHPLARDLQIVVLRDRVFTRPAQRGTYTARTTSGPGIATGTTSAGGIVTGSGMSFVVVADLTAVSADALAIGRARYNGSANYGALLRFNGSTLEFNSGRGTGSWDYAAKSSYVTVGRAAYGSSWTAGQITDTVQFYKNGIASGVSAANATLPATVVVDDKFDVGQSTSSGASAITGAIAGCIEVGLFYATDLSAPEMAAIHEAALRGRLPFLYQAKARRKHRRVPVSAGGSPLDLTQTAGVALASTVSTSGDIQIGTNFNLTQSSAVGLTGSLTTAGDIQIGTTFNLAQTANVGLAGAVGVSGDIQILSGSLDLTQTAAVAMSGTVGLSGDIQIGSSFDLAQTAAVGLTGAVGTTGDVQIGTSFNLAQSAALAMTGSVAVSGDLQSGSAPVVTQSFGNFGWDPRKRLSWKRHELREELEAALDDAPKAVQELVRVPGPDISNVPVREALEVVRKARKSKERLVLRQEIDELHEAVETVATFVKEREAARQARRRKQQHLLLLS